MKYIFLALLFSCSSCNAIEPELQKAISFGKIKELNVYSPNVEKQLIIRLFQAPIFIENCFKETHGVCQYKYFLSVSTYDEYPETNIYSLKTTGEIIDVTWLPTSKVDTAKINLTANKYTADALNNNNDLHNKKVTIHLEITTNKIIESITTASN